MKPISYGRHQSPPEIIRHTVRLYLRFTLSYRDVEELLAGRGLDISDETARRWVLNLDLLSPATCAGCTLGLPALGIWTRW
jgi:transposase-like protein